MHWHDLNSRKYTQKRKNNKQLKMKKMNIFYSTMLMFCFSVQTSFCQDLCQSLGWANYDGQTSVGAPTGGGNVSVTQVTTFDQLKTAVESSSPAVIHVMNSMGNGYSQKTGDVLNFQSNKTIIGVKPGIVLKCSFQIKNVKNIIIRNLEIQGPTQSNSNQYWDDVNIEGSQRVWVDHCVVRDGEDGNFDIVKGSDNVSVTWCIFTYTANGTHNLSNLIGSSDNETVSEGKLNASFINCWWRDVTDRQPRTRYGKIHVVNCLYSMPNGLTSSNGSGAGFKANTRIENCDFYNINNPCKLMSGTTEGGSFPIGCRFTNCTGSQDGGVAGGYTAFTPPYEYKSWMVSVDKVKAQVEKLAGNTLTNPSTCDTVTETKEVELGNSISLYPNPSNSAFQLESPDQVDVKICDVDGKLVQEYKNVTKISFGEHLKSGIYYAKIESKVYKLVKE